MTLAIVLLDVAFSAYKAVWNLLDMQAAPDTTAVVVGAVVVLWIVWIVVELVAVHLIWRGRAAGQWILVASFGLKGIGQIWLTASWLPPLAHTPSIIFMVAQFAGSRGRKTKDALGLPASPDSAMVLDTT